MSRRDLDAEQEQLSAPLRADVRRLSSALGELIAESGGPGLLEDVERLRRATIDLRAGRGPAASARLMHHRARECDPKLGHRGQRQEATGPLRR